MPDPQPLALHITHASRLCYAMQQNAVPPIQELTLTNAGSETFTDLELELRLEPDLCAPLHLQIAGVAAGTTFRLEAIKLELRPDVFANAVEAQRGSLRAVVTKGGVVLASYEAAIDVLAYNEWPGLATLPELLAAFALPNHPAIAAVLRTAAESLAATTGNGALDGYQSRDPVRARAIAEAIYGALQMRGITYVHPPASFEQQGQKVRTPDQILAEGLGTCLDLALLLAACFEQCGLQPLLVIGEGHAVAGVWLTPTTLSSASIEDPLRLRKRLELGELLLIESTTLCATGAQPFAAACDVGAKWVAPAAKFCLAVDIAAARRAGVRPLPVRVAGYVVPEAAAVVPVVQTSATPPIDTTPVAASKPPPKIAEPTDRLERWGRRLLDRTLRNRLLNFIASKRTIPLLTAELPAWEDALQSGSFRLLPRLPAPVEGATADPSQQLRDELRARRLRADLNEEELQDRLVDMFRDARLSLEESGANTLYLALGFLRLYETPTSTQPRRAPLLLLPLQIERVSIAEGYRIALADEEPRLNQTLLLVLQEQFGVTVTGLDTLPEDDKGLDVDKVLLAFRTAIKDVDRWEIEATAAVGFFSFTKYLMWLDLAERRLDLLQSPVLQHLVETPGAPLPQAGEWPTADTLDAEEPANVLCPKDADSSQLCAISAAAAGRSFVLEGPPGTGKSQTITNLIAQSLADGKRVLFVAEKRAALAVVQKRLGDVGLAPFCLEMHSNKGGKKEVVQHLGALLEMARAAEPGQWTQRASELQAARRTLNEHVRTIHQVRPVGVSVFQATAKVIELLAMPLVRGLPTDFDAATLLRAREAMAAVAASAAGLVPLRLHAWHGCGRAEWTPALPREVEPLVGAFAKAVHTGKERFGAVLGHLGLPALTAPSRQQCRELAELCGLLLEPLPAAAFVCGPDFAARLAAAEAMLVAGRNCDEQWKQLAGRWQRGLLQLDIDGLRATVLRWRPSFFLVRWWNLRPVRAQLRGVAVGRLPDWNAVLQDLEVASAARGQDAHVRGRATDAAAWFGAHWRADAPDWALLGRLVQRASKLRALAAAFASEPAAAAALLQRWLELAAFARDGGDAGRELRAATSAHQELRAERDRLAAMLELDLPTVFGADDAPGALDTALQRAGKWSTSLPALRGWCALQRDLHAARELRLQPLLAALDADEVKPAQLEFVFERSFFDGWLHAQCAAEPALATFRGLDHERRIAQFRSLDEELIKLAALVVRARLCARLPSMAADAGGRVPDSSELGLLLREYRKQRRHLPLRQLFLRIPNLIGSLAPCLLMSPLSVAQYLGRRFPPFDLVVFDEASQVPVWDAVGAIGRGRALVVVGDSKKLPPTSFFQRQEDEEAAHDDEVVDELESVLDECGAAGLPRLYLRWHYRSRHESLIAFSNHHYYDNRLLTFPAPQPAGGGLGVRLVPIAGVYDRGRSQTNRVEAEALVAEVLRRLADAQLCQHSLGIVTFSQPQQVLVEDLLDEAVRARPELERFFGNSTAEPVFVKNLENVQGDERDVILFSICYGPDAAGKTWLHFGPINQWGGERRLNVAITRARRELVVFSSLRAEQIDLARTGSMGPRHLRAFLDYAARGVRAITEAVAFDAAGDVESPFEAAVRAALVQKGWEVHAQVGCSGYRIDLGIVDPRQKGRYLAGVECDGASYHAAATARDRDRLRASVLRGLGWQLLRVWSTDFWMEPDGEMQKLDADLRHLLERALPVVEITPEPPPPVAATPAPIAPIAPEANPDTDTAATPADPDGPRPYLETPLRVVGNSDDFFARAGESRLLGVLRSVLDTEAPIAIELLIRRVAAAFDIGRMTERARDRLRAALVSLGAMADDEGHVFWPAGSDRAAFVGFRVPGASSGRRDGDELPAVEVMQAMLWLLRHHGSLDADDLGRSALRQFGLERLGTQLRAMATAVQERMVAAGLAVRDGDRLRLP